MNQDWTTLPDTEAAVVISARVADWDKTEPLRYAGLGLMALAVEKRMLWRHVTNPEDGLPCRSFGTWVRVCAPRGYSTVYQALRDVEELADVPAADLAQIPQSNLATMKQLSSKVRRQPAVLAAAKTQRFVEYVNEHHPEQHIEAKKTLRFNPPRSAAAKIEEALEKAMEHGAGNRDEALELLAVTAMQEWQMEAQVERRVRAACAEEIA